MGLLRDAWFDLSVVCLVVSVWLMRFFYKQYRSAIHAADSRDAELAMAGGPSVVPIVDPPPAQRIPLPSPPPAPLPAPAPIPAPAAAAPPPAAVAPPPAAAKAAAPAVPAAPAVAPAPAPAAAATMSGIRRTEATMTGGLSAGMVYLQALKSQLEGVERELASVKALAAKAGAQEDLILRAIKELGERLAHWHATTGAVGMPPAPFPAPTPAVVAVSSQVPGPVRAPAPTPTLIIAPPAPAAAAPAPLPVVAPPAPAEKTILLNQPGVSPPAPVPVAAPVPPTTTPVPAPSQADKTILLSQPVVIQPPPAAPPVAPAAEPSPGEAKPARKGPVWPI